MSSKSRDTRFVIVVAAFSAFLATFNETFLNIAFTPIMSDFSISVSTVQWLAAAYMLGAAVMVPVSAFLYRSIPTRRLFLITVGLLIAGSLTGALAQSFPVLLAGRIIQSLGTGMLIPVSMNITLEVAPKEKLGIYMGTMGAMTTLGPSVSVIVSGVLLSFADWHMLLCVFAGLSVLCFISGAVFLSNIAKLSHPRLDIVSVILISFALIGILYGISTIFEGTVFTAAASAALGAACLIIFLFRQKKLSEPLIDLRPLKIIPFSVGVILNMFALIILFAMNIIIPVFMQGTLHASPLKAAFTLFPAILLSCVTAPLAGKIYDRHGGGRIIPLGFILMCIFTVVISFNYTSDSSFLLALFYVPVICGSALIIGPVQSFALSHLTGDLNPHGVTVMSTGFQIAGCIGSSVFTGVYASVLTGMSGEGYPAGKAAGTGFTIVSLLAAFIAVLGFILSLYLKRKTENQ